MNLAITSSTADGERPHADAINGKAFTVVINRGRMKRRYQVVITKDRHHLEAIGKPLFRKEFEEHYGFSPDWPHRIM